MTQKNEMNEKSAQALTKEELEKVCGGKDPKKGKKIES